MGYPEGHNSRKRAREVDSSGEEGRKKPKNDAADHIRNILSQRGNGDASYDDAFDLLSKARLTGRVRKEHQHEATIEMARMRLKEQIGDGKCTLDDAFDWLGTVYSNEVGRLRHKAALNMSVMRSADKVSDNKITLVKAFDLLNEIHSDVGAREDYRCSAAIKMAEMRVNEQVGDDKLTRVGALASLEGLRSNNSLSEYDLSVVAGLLTALQRK